MPRAPKCRLARFRDAEDPLGSWPLRMRRRRARGTSVGVHSDDPAHRPGRRCSPGFAVEAVRWSAGVWHLLISTSRVSSLRLSTTCSR